MHGAMRDASTYMLYQHVQSNCLHINMEVLTSSIAFA